MVSRRNRLQSLKPGLKHAIPLVEALLTGIDRRFYGYSERYDLILASATLPQFKLRWLDDAGKEHARSLLYSHVCNLVECDRIASCSESDADSQGEEFFCFGNETEGNRDGKIEVDAFLSDPSRNLDSLRKFPTILKILNGLMSLMINMNLVKCELSLEVTLTLFSNY